MMELLLIRICNGRPRGELINMIAETYRALSRLAIAVNGGNTFAASVLLQGLLADEMDRLMLEIDEAERKKMKDTRDAITAKLDKKLN